MTKSQLRKKPELEHSHLPQYYQGSKKPPSGCRGQVDFPFRQVTFSPSLPNGQAIHRLNF